MDLIHFLPASKHGFKDSDSSSISTSHREGTDFLFCILFIYPAVFTNLNSSTSTTIIKRWSSGQRCQLASEDTRVRSQPESKHFSE